MFTSQGHILILFIEADAGPSMNKNKSNEQLKFFARVSLIDADNASNSLQNFTTSIHTDKIGEEFLFRQVSSLQNLVISLHYLTYDGSDSDRYSAVIPISRLAENVEISQWYQLFRQGTIDDPGSSIRLQIKYHTKDSEQFRTSNTVGRTIAHKKAASTSATVGRGSSMAITSETGKSSFSAATVPTVTPKASSSSSSSSSTIADIDQTTTKRTSIEEKDQDNIDYPPLLRSEPSISTTSMRVIDGNSSATTTIISSQQRADERLVVGIIDYALLFGPVHMNQTTRHVSGTMTSSGNDIPVSSHPLSAPSLSSQASALPTFQNNTSSSHVLLWDRFPIEDHEDSPRPPKIEVN